MKGTPLIMAQKNQKRATEHNAVERRTPRSLLGMLLSAIPRRKKMSGTAAIGRSMFHSAKSTAMARGTQVTGATKTKISPRSAIMVERCLSRRITSGLPRGRY